MTVKLQKIQNVKSKIPHAIHYAVVENEIKEGENPNLFILQIANDPFVSQSGTGYSFPFCSIITSDSSNKLWFLDVTIYLNDTKIGYETAFEEVINHYFNTVVFKNGMVIPPNNTWQQGHVNDIGYRIFGYPAS